MRLPFPPAGSEDNMKESKTNPLGVKESVWDALASKYTRAGTEDILRVCPYQLAINQDVPFDVIDGYVRKDSPVDNLCPARIRNGLLYTLSAIEKGETTREATEDTDAYGDAVREIAGSTCIPKSRVYDLLEALLGLEEGVIDMPLLDAVIKNLVSAGRVSVNRIGDQIFLANKKTYIAEHEAAECVRTLLEKDGLVKIDAKSKKAMYAAVDQAQAMTGLLLSQEQKNAVCMILQSRISILTGGPGTGKSATLKILVESLKLLRPYASIRCIAPTGQAASRMVEATGCEATTIHKALGMTPGETKSHAELTNDIVLVDESSMIDAHLFSALLKSLSEKTSVVFIGDTAQLPSISAGNVLAELIQSRVPVSQLTKVFRQGDNSIAFNCAKIKNGNTSLDMDESFTFIECKDSKAISKKVCELFAAEVEKSGLDSVCCLTPYRHLTKTGVNSLNRAIRSKLHDTASLTWCDAGGIRVYTGDKIVFLRNRYGLVNGETGIAVRASKGQCICSFGNKEITLRGDDLASIEPAYAQTVHKAQGQEYKTCIVVIDEAHSSFMNKALVYTSLSRAKQRCICVGSHRALSDAVAHTAGRRFSCLSGLIGG